jgi:integrase/recombinase XerC
MMGTETDDLLLYYDYLAKLGRSPVTIRNYLSNLKLFSRWFTKTSETERIDFTQVTEIDLLSYRNHLQYSERHKTSTINQHVAALRSFFSFLHNSGSISEAVAKNLRPLSKPFLRVPEVPKRVQVLKLFRMVDTQNDRGKRDFAILQLFVQCGLRLSEVANIQLDDINISERKGTLRIITGKSGSERKVHLNKTARHAIKAYLRVRPTLPETNKLFLSQLNRPLSTRSIYHLTKKYLEATGMPDLSCHSLRHLFATNLYNRHKDILLVKEALGHKTLESTLRYSHKSEEDIAKAMENSNLNIYKDSS